jgi:hypothetical protein
MKIKLQTESIKEDGSEWDARRDVGGDMGKEDVNQVVK